MRKEIMRFKWNNKDFITYFYNQEIQFCIKKDGIETTDLSDEELILAHKVYTFLVGQKEHYIKLSKTKCKSFEFDTYINIRNNLYSFIGTKNTQEEKQALAHLNYYFNSATEFMYENFSDEEEFKIQQVLHRIKVLLKIDGILLTVFVASQIVLSTLPIIPNNYQQFYADYYMDKVRIEAYTPQSSYDFNEIEYIIDNNPNLHDSEKKFLKSMKTEFDENYQYMNLELVKENLKQLQINYHPHPENSEDESLQKLINSGVLGRYVITGDRRNQIDLLPTEGYKTESFESSNKSVLTHEVNHALSDYGWLVNMTAGQCGNIYSNNDTLCEIFNEVFSREYLRDFSKDEYIPAYNALMPVANVLCEILDEETIKNFKFKTDSYYITDYLSKLGVPLEHIYDFYKSLEHIRDSFKNFDLELLSESQHIYQLLNEFYKAKYGFNINSDLIASVYLYQTLYSNSEIDSFVEKNLPNITTSLEISPKGYISINYKRDHPNVIVHSITGEEYLLNDENRFLNDKKYRRK